MSWLQKLLPPRINEHAGRQEDGGARRAVDQVPVVRSRALSHRPREQPLRLPEVRLPRRASPARERIEQLLDPGRPLRDRLGGRAGRQPQVQGPEEVSRAPRRGARGDGRDRRARRACRAASRACRSCSRAFEFEFMGGSMGSVVGERFVRGVRVAYENRIPFVCISASGGARMQEGVNSLFQMAKTTAVLQELTKARLPFVSILTDPTMGGVSASFAFVADLVLAEPGALIGFAGPRVIEQTVREKLPEGFQRAEFLVEKGALDMIVDRRQLRDELARLLALLTRQPRRRLTLPAARCAVPQPTASAMNRPATLAAWLAYLETLHPKAIALGLERVRAVHARLRRAARLPGRHRRPAPTARARPARCSKRCCAARAIAPASTRRRTSCATTSACASAARRSDDAALVAAFNAVEDARARRTCRSRISSSARWPRCGCSRAPSSTSLILEVGLGGRLDAVNIVDADVAVRDEHRPRPHGLPRARRARTSAARRPASSAPGGPAVCARARSAGDADRRTRASIGAPLLQIGRDFGYVAERTQWRYWGPRRRALRPAASRRCAARISSRTRRPRSRSLDLLQRSAAVSARGAMRDGLLAVEPAGPLPGAAGAARDRARRRAQSARRARARGDARRRWAIIRETIAVFGMLADKDIARRDRRGARRASTAGSSRRCRARAARRADAMRDAARARRRRAGARSARSTTSTRRSPRRAERRAKLIESSFSDRS